MSLFPEFVNVQVVAFYRLGWRPATADDKSSLHSLRGLGYRSDVAYNTDW